MDWGAVGAIGSILGAIGVICSLVYLAIQIRNQNRESQLAAATELAAQWSAAMSDIAVNVELAKALDIGFYEPDKLAPHQYVQFSAHLNRVFRDVETMYIQHQAGRLGDDLWKGVSVSTVQLTQCPGVRHWWKTRDGWFGRAFSAFIQHHIDTEPAIAANRGATGNQLPVASAGEAHAAD